MAKREQLKVELDNKLLDLVCKLKAVREYKNISQDKLADMCEVERKCICRFEKEAVGRIDTLIRIVDALGYQIKIEKKKEK